MIVNSLIALALGFSLWIMNFWSAGDSKLFFAYSLMIPLSVYGIDRIPYFESFYLIFNSFIPFLFYAIFITVREKIVDVKYGGIREEFTQDKIVENIAYTFAITWFADMILVWLGIANNILSVVITTSLIMYVLNRFIIDLIPESFHDVPLRKISLIVIAVIISVFRFYLEKDRILTFEFAYTFMIYYIIVGTVKSYVKSEAKVFYTKKVHVLNLIRGNVLADTILKKDDRYIVDKSNSVTAKLNAEFPSELGQDEINRMAKLFKQKKLDFSSVLIHKTMPFAPLMFIGALLTIFAKGAFTALI